jgi:uncharacterized protein
MRTSTLSLIAALALSWIFSSSAVAKGPEIDDRADFFSEHGERQATGLMEELQSKYGVEVRVETFSTPPDDQANNVKSMSARERGQYFQELLKRLAHERNAHGIFILICREPSHLRMGVSKELHRRGFTDSDRDDAVNALLTGFKSKNYDRGLIQALETIRSRAGRGLNVAAAPGASSGKLRTPGAPASAPANRQANSPLMGMGGWLCMGMGALLAVVLLVNIVSALFRRNGGMTPAGAGGAYGGPGGYGPGGYGGYGGGGSIFGGMLSGLGGALLGNWIYDQWGGRSAHAGYPDSGHAPGPMNTPPPDNYDDFSSGGGDFGDSGGGDFGGGDFGGGDFGGGDMGGGGGDGGGDF